MEHGKLSETANGYVGLVESGRLTPEMLRRGIALTAAESALSPAHRWDRVAELREALDYVERPA